MWCTTNDVYKWSKKATSFLLFELIEFIWASGFKSAAFYVRASKALTHPNRPHGCSGAYSSDLRIKLIHSRLWQQNHSSDIVKSPRAKSSCTLDTEQLEFSLVCKIYEDATNSSATSATGVDSAATSCSHTPTDATRALFKWPLSGLRRHCRLRFHPQLHLSESAFIISVCGPEAATGNLEGGVWTGSATRELKAGALLRILFDLL